MISRTLTIGSARGLHARPAKLFVDSVVASGLTVRVAKGDGDAVNAASILSIMTLGIAHGDSVTIEADTDDAEAVAGFADILTADHDAE